MEGKCLIVSENPDFNFMEIYENSVDNIKQYFSELNFTRLLVIGKGSIFREVNSILNIESSISIFLESKKKEPEYMGIPIMAIHEFLDNNSLDEQVLILVCTGAWEEIKGSLNKQQLLNLTQAQIYNPYENYRWVLELKNLPVYKLEDKMLSFINKIDNKVFLPKKNKSAVVFISEWSGKALPFQLIAKSIILAHQGYDVTILYNDFSEYGDWYKGEGFSSYQHGIYKKIFNQLNDRIQIKIDYLSQFPTAMLNNFEKDMLKKYTYYSKTWNTRKYIINHRENYYRRINESLEKTIHHLKGYFTNKSFDSAFIWSGIHNYYNMANIVLKSFKIPFYTEDYLNYGYAFNKNAPVVYQKEIPRIKNNILDNHHNVARKLLSIAKDAFQQKSNFNGYKIESNSVVIPLNIFWDSASYTDNDLFVDFHYWLRETIKFVTELCKENIYIRQHPQEKNYNSGSDLKRALEEEFKNNPYFHFIDAYSGISTYDLIQGAKIVLPNTSTVGIEAAILGKEVILKNDVYYSKEKFAYKATSIEDYFNKIKYILVEDGTVCSSQYVDDAYLIYGLTAYGYTDKSFGHFYPEVSKWIEMGLKEILALKSVQHFIDLIENDTSIYENIVLNKNLI